jgi:hypothetical protein
LVTRFIDHLYTQLETTSNKSASANLRNSQITTASAKLFPACRVFTSRSPVTFSNSGHSSVSALKSCLHSLRYRTLLTVNRNHCSNCLGYNISARTTQKTPFFYCCVRVRCRGKMSTEPLPRNSRCLFDHLAVVA